MSLFRRSKKSTLNATPCSACGESLTAHGQYDIASARMGTEDDGRLTQLIATGKWSEARSYQAANAPADIRVWRIIRCHDGRIGVVSFVMPIEMWSDDYYETTRFLSDDESAALTAAVEQSMTQL